MNLVSISMLYDALSTRLSGAPRDTLDSEIQAALREFYIWSGAFLYETPALSLKANQQRVYFNPQQVGRVTIVHQVEVEDIQVGFRGTLEQGAIDLKTTYPNDKPKSTVGHVSLIPHDLAMIPEDVYIFDKDCIVDGVTGRMYMIPDKPWSNAVQATYYLKRFREGMNRARVRVRAGFTKADAAWKYPAW